eukprot:1166193-Amphidinium_carterae.2
MRGVEHSCMFCIVPSYNSPMASFLAEGRAITRKSHKTQLRTLYATLKHWQEGNSYSYTPKQRQHSMNKDKRRQSRVAIGASPSLLQPNVCHLADAYAGRPLDQVLFPTDEEG